MGLNSFAIAAAAMLSTSLAPAAAPVRYELRATIDPAAHTIRVEGTVTSGTGGVRPVHELETIDHPIANEREDYARGFAATEGTIQPAGVFLSGSSGWYPAPPEGSLVTFTLEVSLPAGWDAISQGRRTRHERTERGTRVTFVCDDPQEEIWLIAAPWTETARSQDGLDAWALLRERDDALSAKYLDATGPYVAMYSRLLGPYPYSKFALVENFWETGYGMPSFTLLGGKVLRLPFILTTSYPHEILHNWWGNGVYVAREGGNWSEGLTAYLADHLFAEQKGGGAAYRQESLQKYADYASRSKDFPLASFNERHSPATEAVGYGKSLMLFHMIRRDLGDAAFVRGLRAFYAAHKFERAGFDDLRAAFGAASGRDLAPVFDPWVQRTGAPKLRVAGVTAEQRQDGTWRIAGAIEQTQAGAPYALKVPVLVTMEGRPAALPLAIASAEKRSSFALEVPQRPLRLDVDPEFDLFRTLDVEEAPPALSAAFGADACTVVLPAKAPATLRDAYRAMAVLWNTGRAIPMTIVDDDGLESLPASGSLWIFGYENRFVPAVAEAFEPFGAEPVPARARARTLVARRAVGAPEVIAFVGADRAEQVPGLARKLPHYHKYSYLAFEGDEPVNVDKGRWSVSRSPMTAYLDGTPGMAVAPPREPLAELPPAFSEDRMMATVRALAAPEMKGRGFGTPELERAAARIASDMKSTGLEVSTSHGNVIGVLRGTNADWAGQSVVVGAHFDHLGVSAAGAVHPGADDNASGVAVLLELARQLAASGSPPRSVVFAAFTGEETGLRGSKAYVAAASAWPASKTIGMVNLDTVGRLGTGKLLVLGAGSADEWIHIANGAGYVTGVPVQAVVSDPGGSDQASFLAAGVPAVQLFTGANPDYHAASDTADKIDGKGLVKVAAVTREFVAYLAGRDRPLTSRLGAATGAGTGPAASGERRVTLGTIPDYAFAGPGVRITGTMPGSPAERAGLREGDVLVRIGDSAIGGMKDFSEALKRFDVGARVGVAFLRDGAPMTVEVILASR